MKQQADKDRVVIFDTTLRDGEQSPGATMTHEEKLEIAELLDDMGVDIIEAGFPIASEGDFKAVSEIAERSKTAVICGLARANFGDIDRCWDAVRNSDKPRIHTFIGTSPLHRAIPNLDKDQMAERIHDTVTHARNLCDNIQWSPMDATRTEHDYLCRVVEIAIKAGATTINIPDTVGYTAPLESADLIKMLIEKVPGADEVIFATHCHNDLGMATANSLAAVEGGARQIECTINGLGERAGNAALEEIVMALKTRSDAFGGFKTGIKTHEIVKSSRLISRMSGLTVQRSKAIVGENAFAHSSGIHQDGILKKRETYEIVDPQEVGWGQTELPLTKHSGRAAVAARLRHLGFSMSEAEVTSIFSRFKEIGDKKKFVYDDDLAALVDGQRTDVIETWSLDYVHVTTGIHAIPTATVRLKRTHASQNQDLEILEDAGVGDGPVDAALKAIDRLTKTNGTLKDYLLRSVSQGKDAMGEVVVKVDFGKGEFITGRGASTDIIVASAKAYLNAVNRKLAASSQKTKIARKRKPKIH